MTKDEASDLKSLIDRARQAALALQNAQYVNDEVERQIVSFINKMQYPPKPVVTDGEPVFGSR
jgi:hypothetical protein